MDMDKSNECKKSQENGTTLNSDGRLHVQPCKHCGKTPEQECTRDSAMQGISPQTSLTSTGSCVSSSSDFSVDANSHDKANQEEGTPLSCQESLTHRYGQSRCLSLTTPVNNMDKSDMVMETNLRKSHSDNGFTATREVDSRQTKNELEACENGFKRTSSSSNADSIFHDSCDTEITSKIWEPPEAEDSEDDMEDSVANDDDDDDNCGDGTQWGKPISLSSFRREGSGSFKFKEDKQKAIEKIMNEKFKPLVNQLLKYFGVHMLGEDDKSWVDIVTSLSWEAASFVKPDPIESKAMDPDGYVKVKCIATGSPSQSQVIKGLVFKKHASHKHMPTKYKNPKLLLIQGMLGENLSGLSSFNSMNQETDYLRSVTEMMDKFHPNVVLVEKSVSRDVQECILQKGMTLVFDMKFHRLQRIARCTSSPIVSFDTFTHQKLKHCEYFRIEKFVEELAAVGESGKKPSKTLMFLEGCPTRLGCTILLKGAHSDELKRIKHVLKYSVVMAYHLTLETSFLMDQKAMLSTIPICAVSDVYPNDEQSQQMGSANLNVSRHEDSTGKSTFPCTTFDIPISEGIHGREFHSSNLGLEWNDSMFCEIDNPAIFAGISSLSASINKVTGEKLPDASPASYRSLQSNLGINGIGTDSRIKVAVEVLPSADNFDNSDAEAKGSSDEEKSVDIGPLKFKFAPREGPPDTRLDSENHDNQSQNKDDISTILESQSILVLMSIRNISRGIICEQRRFSHIKFYKDLDVPLGKFLRENILNQKCMCNACGELPEAHFYYYAHHNKQLTIQVKQLLGEKRLPGEAEGKLWMWSRCGVCKLVNRTPKSTKRVLISAAGRGLSFGKFLELSFSQNSSSGMLSRCGHSLYRDFLHFFGLGPMVAMFSYTLVTTYSISLPPQKLDFKNSISRERLFAEIQNVYTKGMLLFEEIDKYLQKLESKFKGSSLNLCDSMEKFSDIEELLRQEKFEFEESIKNAVAEDGNTNHGIYKLLRLNRLLWELFLESCIWLHRLHSVLSIDRTVISNGRPEKVEQEELKDDAARSRTDETSNMVDSDEVLDYRKDVEVKVERLVEENGSPVNEKFVDQDPLIASMVDNETGRDVSPSPARSCDDDSLPGPNISDHLHPKKLPLFDQLQTDRAISIVSENDSNESLVNLHEPILESSKGRIWTPFSKLRQEDVKDLQGGYLPRFESISSSTPDFLPSTYQLIMEEGSRLHIVLDNDNHIVSDYEGELTSVIACALALLKDKPVPMEDFDEYSRGEKGMAAKTTSSSPSLSRISSLTSPHISSFSSFSSDGPLSASFSLDESLFSSFNGSDLWDSLVSYETLHPGISLGFANPPGKGKYSVVCRYAGLFRDLRNRCCPSEHDYIASLSRCRNWEAKGGKSKAFFAKTLDDRFIIKEIKKTEVESFLKFAPDYFRYMNESFELGNQTCLAKILGIYEVSIRQAKSGKEIKQDLMVMENLTFGRKTSKQYDLKGALHARFNSAADASGDVLLDQNFVNDMNASPLYVSNTAKRHLQRAVWNDTTFLNSINVMDYSLLVGVDAERRELVCGIIDYLRQYTWDKQLETWVKSSLVVPKNLLPTVISPKEYKKRFRKFMSTYFLSVPDHWCSQDSSCEVCES